MFRLLAISGLLLGLIETQSTAHDFVAVFFDDDSAKELGADAPLPRALKSKLIRKLHEEGARGLVIKFFEDLPGDEEQDREYAKTICLIPTTLQACLCLDGSTNALAETFYLTETKRFRIESAMSGEQGYIPLRRFSECARGVGFVDLERPYGIPLIERYQKRLVKSLYVTALELETNELADFSSGTNVFFGKRSLSFDEVGEHTITGVFKKLDYVPFHKVLHGEFAPGTFRGKVVILGYDGPRIHEIDTPGGKVRAHRLFVQSLVALTQELQPVKR